MKRTHRDDPLQNNFSFAPTILPTGDGSFIVTPGRPIIENDVTPRQAARFLNISRQGVYRLLEMGLLEHRRPSVGKILISLESLKRHKEKTRDPEFWDTHRNPSQASHPPQAS